ncbi:hypothetical protein HYU19_04775 [Candidatus Woesearchaeota archaeon]|nr:hypothetical protein [Candidatus Woesearchaeota archaeon]
MATLLDAAVLENFTQIFSFLLVVVIVYGLLQMTKALGENKGIHILIAFFGGLLTLLIPDVSAIIGVMIPWLTLFFIFCFFIIVAYKIFGATDSDIAGYLKADRSLGWIIFIVCLVIIIWAFSTVYGQRLVPITTGGQPEVIDGTAVPGPGGAVGGGVPVAGTNFQNNLAATFFHPKVLGIILIFLIGVFTIGLLAMETTGGH